MRRSGIDLVKVAPDLLMASGRQDAHCLQIFGTLGKRAGSSINTNSNHLQLIMILQMIDRVTVARPVLRTGKA